MFLKRHIEDKIYEALKFMPILLLRGARQTGKTTLVKELGLKNKYNYLTFDNLNTLSLAKNDPVGFISGLEKPVILDEIQRAIDLFLPIKSDVDAHRTNGRYILTGSADPLLLPHVGDSLAGRIRLLPLWPLSQGELLQKKETFLDKVCGKISFSLGQTIACSKEDLLHRVIQGGYPTIISSTTEQQKQDWFNDYISLVLQKDILDLSRIEKVSQIPNLFALLASRVGGLINLEELSRSLKLPSATLGRYLDLLKMLFLVYLLPPWEKNLGKRIVKSSKIYLVDTALQLFMLNMNKDHLWKDSQLLGKIVENFIVMELVKQISFSNYNIKMYHYRDYAQTEVDIILEIDGRDLIAIEIKTSETLSKEDFKGLQKFQEVAKKNLRFGIVLYAGNTAIPFSENMMALPISILWE